MAFLKYTDGQLISYEIQDVKPHAVIYRAICDKYSINPGEALFIDDSEINIAGANAFDLHTIHFTDYQSANARLKELLLTSGLHT